MSKCKHFWLPKRWTETMDSIFGECTTVLDYYCAHCLIEKYASEQSNQEGEQDV